MSASHIRMTAFVHGHVQSVGFRWWTRSRALELGLVGYAANQRDGRVLVVAEGARESVDALLAALRSGNTPGRVDAVIERFDDVRGDLTGFVEK
ncbi:acylphosphatase [Gordonia effusa NBRC 100432]|uniref:acylphosphatase n=1 Tax=Gordonia effusa NBRC 100432 TaxID=1077974 RepID=H0QZ24_9ACTN|nr:acylphosphatase [Gordonia effusa]GAB18075.1 acylphosphatase [Gordonia effusa NBRC 100432]